MIRRGARYTAIGVATFIIDLALLFLFIDALDLNIFLSTAVAFIGALTLNYFLSRHYVFPHSNRSGVVGYVYFIGFAITGMAITVVLMWVLVSFTALHFAASRIIIALMVGIVNYFANLVFNFKVVGVEIDQLPTGT